MTLRHWQWPPRHSPGVPLCAAAKLPAAACTLASRPFRPGDCWEAAGAETAEGASTLGAEAAATAPAVSLEAVAAAAAASAAAAFLRARFRAALLGAAAGARPSSSACTPEWGACCIQICSVTVAPLCAGSVSNCPGCQRAKFKMDDMEVCRRDYMKESEGTRRTAITALASAAIR